MHSQSANEEICIIISLKNGKWKKSQTDVKNSNE